MRHTTKPVISSGDTNASYNPRSPLLRPCPRCGAAERQSCRRTIGSGDGAYTRRLLSPHAERTKHRGSA